MRVEVQPSGRVTCTGRADVGISAARLWSEIRDLPRFATHDFFHAEFKVDGQLAAGARLTILHRFGPWEIQRRGRVTRWEDGIGYSFSDVSLRGRGGFPHVFRYQIEPTAADRSTLIVSVRGSWTTRWIPYWAARLWMWWVFAQILLAVRRELAVCVLGREEAKTRRAMDHL